MEYIRTNIIGILVVVVGLLVVTSLAATKAPISELNSDNTHPLAVKLIGIVCFVSASTETPKAILEADW